ncbi:MAG: DUF1501 domain-containing protein [Chthoniobacteraceae bacterium]
MKTCCSISTPRTRRDFLALTSASFGWTAFSALAAEKAGANPLAPKQPHFTARAKRVIFLFMQGGPSHLETFDWKPELARVGKGGNHQLLGSVFKFAPSGQSGLMISEVFPQLAKHADELCVLNGMQTRTNSHVQATVALHTGSETFVRPSFGAWITYGLGSLAEDLPGFVTIDPLHDQGGAMNYGSAFLPATFQGSRLNGSGNGVPNIDGLLGSSEQRRQLDLVQRMNKRLLAKVPGNPEIEGVIQSYELAYQMQTSVPGVLDINSEPEATRELYGLNDGATQSFGRQCLLARRLAEKGVRFIQLTHMGWDHHNNMREGLRGRAEAIDQPIAGLLTDLKQRGMLKDTLVVWGGEFGRSPHDDKGDGNGRGHHGRGYTMWMAGGGVKGGYRHGATDEMGGEVVEGKMDTQDLHATILHLLGLDHEALTYRYAGRDFRLTNVSGKVARAILS